MFVHVRDSLRKKGQGTGKSGPDRSTPRRAPAFRADGAHNQSNLAEFALHCSPRAIFGRHRKMRARGLSCLRRLSVLSDPPIYQRPEAPPPPDEPPPKLLLLELEDLLIREMV